MSGAIDITRIFRSSFARSILAGMRIFRKYSMWSKGTNRKCPLLPKHDRCLLNRCTRLNQIIYDDNIFSRWISFFQCYNSFVSYTFLSTDNSSFLRNCWEILTKSFCSTIIRKYHHFFIMDFEQTRRGMEIRIDTKKIKNRLLNEGMNIKNMNRILRITTRWKWRYQVRKRMCRLGFSFFFDTFRSTHRKIRHNNPNLISSIFYKSKDGIVVFKEFTSLRKIPDIRHILVLDLLLDSWKSEIRSSIRKSQKICLSFSNLIWISRYEIICKIVESRMCDECFHYK